MWLDGETHCWRCHINHRIQRNQGNFLLLVLIVAGSAILGAGGGRATNSLIYLWTLWTALMTSMARCGHECNSDMNIMKVTNCFWVGFKFYSIGEIVFLVVGETTARLSKLQVPRSACISSLSQACLYRQRLLMKRLLIQRHQGGKDNRAESVA